MEGTDTEKGSESDQLFYDKTADFLAAEAVLDSTIRPPALPAETLAEPDRILLTGATGFLGAFLLAELLQHTSADIFCLVRAHTPELAQQKLHRKLESCLIWDEQAKGRIIPVLGDLSQPFLGLSEGRFQTLAAEIDVIYHNGAWVHHASPYSLLKAANVLGAQEVLRLACHTTVKPVHFMSATSVFSPEKRLGTPLIREQDSILGHAPWGGYSQSKWVAERLMMIGVERGVPVSIYRLGRLSGHSQTGVFNSNDFLYRLIIGCVQLGYVPENAEMLLDMIPIDYASQAIIHLSKQSISHGKTYHLVHPHPVSSHILFESLRSLGFSIQPISSEQWRTKLLQVAETSPEHPLYPLIPLLAPTDQLQPAEPNLKFDCQNTLAGLAGSGIVCPPIDQSLLKTYFSHLSQTGWFSRSASYHPPQTKRKILLDIPPV